MSPSSRKRRGLATWLASTSTPFFVLDRRRRVVFFNAGCERLTGWSASDVLGQVCDFVSDPDPAQVESLTGVLCPPPEVFDGHEQAIPAFVLTRSGGRLSRLVRFFPLWGEEQAVERVLGTFSTLPQPSTPAAPPMDYQLHAELAVLRADIQRRFDLTTVVGRSVSFQRLMNQIRLAARHAGSVHLQGEPGTGKEHLARVIHYHGESRRFAFVPVDCALMTRDQLSETVRRVLRDVRDPDTTQLTPGTLYFKHVDRLPDSIQELLLKEFGDLLASDLRSDVMTERAEAPVRPLRLMSSSLRGLDAAVHHDALREEVAILLTDQQILVPSLRERPEDIPLIAQHFLESLNRDEESQVAACSGDVWTALRKYPWPGNHDELRAVITEARDRCTQPLIQFSDLPFRFRTGADAQSVGPRKPVQLQPLAETLARVEREHIEQALARCGRNKSQAAQLLGITRARLYRRMQILGLIELWPDATE
jgi:DNA-binding NtrC family response regulator